jgi:sRNA-binding protein
MMTKRKIKVGDRVEAGTGEDHDTGVVHEIKDSEARVGWDSGVETMISVSRLTVLK